MRKPAEHRLFGERRIRRVVVADPNYVGRLPDNVSFIDIAPILCAGVTVYKGLKATDTRPGDWVVVSGIGGLGHMAVQYAKAMGLNVIAVDVDDAKLELGNWARHSASMRERRPSRVRQEGSRRRAGRGRDRGLAQGLRAGARHGRARRNRFARRPAARFFPLPIFDTVLNGVTVRGSIVGTRLDLQEALNFAGEGKVKATVATEPLENINNIFARMRAGDIQGRIVIDFQD